MSRSSRIERRLIVLGAMAAFCLPSAGCSVPSKKTDTVKLQPWAGRFQKFFDNSIDPSSVGLSLDGSTADEDPLLPSRVADSEMVGLMRVQTITKDSFGTKTSYTLILQLEGQPLAPARTTDRRFELHVRKGMPAFGIVERLGSDLRRRKFIGFLRRFQAAETVEWRWHLTAATKEVAEVVRSASTIGP